MNETYVTIAGNATTDPVPRFTKTGERMATFRLASNVRRRIPETGEYVDVETTFLGVVAYRTLAENVVASLTKGQPVLVHGRLRVREWDSGEKSGTNVELEAVHIGHDLARGRAVFQKRARAWEEGATPESNRSEPAAAPFDLPAGEASAAPDGSDDRRRSPGAQGLLDPARADTDDYAVVG